MTARIGMVNYINTAPIYEVWKEKVNRPDWQVIEAPPSALNRMLAAGQLDLGFVSSREYNLRPEKYQILDDLSISATGPVGSVFLFSRIDPRQLDKKLVLLTGQSDTSVSLVKIILEEFYQVRPGYAVGNVLSDSLGEAKPDAVLAIGDDALRLHRENVYPHCLDLGEVWNRNTGLPFVFSVCAVSEDFISREPQTVREIQHAFLACRREGRQRLREISEAVASRIPMDSGDCYRYLQAIEHDLGPVKQQALEKFFTYLIQRGEGPSNSLPLKIFA